ncbi:MAG: metallophosphoesterase [Roseburia sp.]|nr:metallophosphoesterase [Roseburia sp.]
MKNQTYHINAPVTRTIAQVSDLHNKDGQPVLASLRQHSPDIIVISGDLVMGRKTREEKIIMEEEKNILPFLYGCVQIAPTYLSLGNHEGSLCDEDMDILASTGVTVLDNRWIERDGLLIGGLTSAIATNFGQFRKKNNTENPINEKNLKPYQSSRSHSMRLFPDSTWLDTFEHQPGYKILLSHHPEYWCIQEPMLINRHIDLVLSGHAHGGQIRFCGHGLFAPGQGCLPKYTSGIHEGPYGRMIISRGLANTAKMIPRLFNPRELIYIELG